MKYFAKLGLSSKVIRTHLVNDDVAPTEKAGIDFLRKLHDYPFWVQNFKDGTRKNYGARGFTYDEDRDAFIPKKPYTSWVLNELTCRWEAPTSMPDDGKDYKWNEETTSWDEIEVIS